MRLPALFSSVKVTLLIESPPGRVSLRPMVPSSAAALPGAPGLLPDPEPPPLLEQPAAAEAIPTAPSAAVPSTIAFQTHVFLRSPSAMSKYLRARRLGKIRACALVLVFLVSLGPAAPTERLASDFRNPIHPVFGR